MQSSGLRIDGRKPNQLRPLQGEFSLLQRADGSAKLSAGETSVVASVYGPRPAHLAHEHPEQSIVEVSVRPAHELPTPSDKKLETHIRDAVMNVFEAQNYPRCVLSITLQIIHDDGSLFSTAINCVSMALLDAGIPMSGVLAAVTCGALRETGTHLLDICKDEKDAIETEAFLCCSSSLLTVPIVFSMQGESESDGVFALMRDCRAAVKSIIAFMRLAHERKVKRDIVSRSFVSETITITEALRRHHTS